MIQVGSSCLDSLPSKCASTEKGGTGSWIVTITFLSPSLFLPVLYFQIRGKIKEPALGDSGPDWFRRRGRRSISLPRRGATPSATRNAGPIQATQLRLSAYRLSASHPAASHLSLPGGLP